MLRSPALLATLLLLTVSPAPGRNGQTRGARPDRTPHPTRHPAPLRELGRKDQVRLVYFVPADRKPVPEWHARFKVLATFVNDLYLKGVRRHGLATDGLDFEFHKGRLQVHLIRGPKPAAWYSGAPKYKGLHQYNTVLKEVSARLGSPGDNLYLILSEAYDEGPSRIEWPGTVALGGRWSPRGGVCIFSGWILREELCATTVAGMVKLLGDTTPVKGRRAHGGHRTPSARFQFIEDGLGAIAHELGHALGLPHDMRDQARHIMANGFRNLRVNYLPALAHRPRVGFSLDNARMLANTRFLNPAADRKDNRPPKVKLTHPKSVTKDTFDLVITGQAEDRRGLGAVMVFLECRDSVVAGAALKGPKAAFTLKVPLPLKMPDRLKLRITVTDRSGNTVMKRLELPVTGR